MLEGSWLIWRVRGRWREEGFLLTSFLKETTSDRRADTEKGMHDTQLVSQCWVVFWTAALTKSAQYPLIRNKSVDTTAWDCLANNQPREGNVLTGCVSNFSSLRNKSHLKCNFHFTILLSSCSLSTENCAIASSLSAYWDYRDIISHICILRLCASSSIPVS